MKYILALLLALLSLPAFSANKCPPGSFFANNANKVFNQTIEMGMNIPVCAGIMGEMKCYKAIYVPANNEPMPPWSISIIVYSDSTQQALIEANKILKSVYDAPPGTPAAKSCSYKVDSFRVVQIKAAPNKHL